MRTAGPGAWGKLSARRLNIAQKRLDVLLRRRHGHDDLDILKPQASQASISIHEHYRRCMNPRGEETLVDPRGVDQCHVSKRLQDSSILNQNSSVLNIKFMICTHHCRSVEVLVVYLNASACAACDSTPSHSDAAPRLTMCNHVSGAIVPAIREKIYQSPACIYESCTRSHRTTAIRTGSHHAS